MIRCCIDRVLPSHRIPGAVTKAVEENPFNSAFHLAQRAAGVPGLAALASDKKWATGRTLPITFRGGTLAMRNVVLQACSEWMKYANIRIVPASQNGVIRCTFDPSLGSWSYVGTDILSIPKTEPTMNIGWGPDLPTCLHEIGHTLGLIHEHQNPKANIPWDVRKVVNFYEGPPNRWSREEVYQQVLTRYNGPLTNGGFDKYSIMEYPIPRELVTDPTFAVGWNTDLSDKDKSFIGLIYPGMKAHDVIV